MYDDMKKKPFMRTFWIVVSIILATGALVGLGFLIRDEIENKKNDDVGKSNGDIVTDVILKARNRLEVQTIFGNVTTVRETSGGIFGIFDGKLIMRQPFSVAYYVNMSDLTLSDYIWNDKRNTLFIRLPPVDLGVPNIDESRQITVSKGWIITRDMQNRLRKAIAIGAIAQANGEAAKPENMESARRNARKAIIGNLEPSLRKAGLRNIHIEVIEDKKGSRSTWDVSRSIAQVYADENT